MTTYKEFMAKHWQRSRDAMTDGTVSRERHGSRWDVCPRSIVVPGAGTVVRERHGSRWDVCPRSIVVPTAGTVWFCYCHGYLIEDQEPLEPDEDGGCDGP